ncbi:MAG TPA: MASE3 domain-containing protein [Clostridia bacterium]|nr:MASE3 domain-containing protein [Clostridia bacterium]
MKSQNATDRASGAILLFLAAAVVVGGLLVARQYNFLLFHMLAEIFSVVIGTTVFLLAWNARRFLKNDYLLLLGIALFFVAILDLVHALSYKGMPLVEGQGANRATQLWIAARYVQSLALVLAPLLLHRRVRAELLLFAGAALTLGLLFSIFSGLFPNCYTEGTGLTPFKRGSEYIICLMLIVAGALLWRKRRAFHPPVFKLLAGSLLLTIGSELAFTFYLGVYDLSNVVGHCLKILAFYLVYKAIIETGLTQPYALLLRESHLNEERFRTLAAASFEGVVMVEHGRLVDANPQLAQMLGYPREALMGRHVRTFFPPEKADQYVRELETGGHDVQEHELVRADDSILTVEIRNQTVDLQARQVRMAVIRDITDRKQFEVRLARLVDERTRSLQETTKQLNDFCYSLAHDLKAPIRSQVAYATLLLTEHQQALGDEGRLYATRIKESAERQGRLVDDLLAHVSLGRTELPLQPVLLSQVIEAAASDLRAETARARVQTSDLGVWVLANVSSLHLVVLNLLSNALKFVPRGQEPEVRIWAAPGDTCVRLWVQDNGIGIRPDLQDRIFGVFERLHSQEEYPGTGIGLAIVQRAVERMGGRVGLESELGKGSRFWVELTKAEPAG